MNIIEDDTPEGSEPARPNARKGKSGKKGTKGAKGSKGKSGVKGSKSKSGKKGPKGAKGPQGKDLRPPRRGSRSRAREDEDQRIHPWRSDGSDADSTYGPGAAREAPRPDGREDRRRPAGRGRSPEAASPPSSPARQPAMRRPVVRLRPPSLDGSRRVTFGLDRLRSPERGPTPPRRPRAQLSPRGNPARRPSGPAEDHRARGEAQGGRGGGQECEQQ